MFSWLKNKNKYTQEQNVIAAYGKVLDEMFSQNPDDEIFDVRKLPYPKNAIRQALKEVIQEDPEDEGLRNCYLCLARFQLLPACEITDEEAEKLVQMVIEEENALKTELLMKS